MDLRALRYFSIVAETLSFSRAAKQLRRSQPGLSRSIKELEAELGIELFERIGRRIVLRPEGERLLLRARDLLASADALADDAHLLVSGRSVILRVGGASNTLERVMPTVLRLYQRRWPEVDIQLRSEGGSALLAALERGELDVAIVRTTNSDLLECAVVFPTHLVAVAHRRHRLAKRRSLTIDDLRSERLLVPPATFTSRTLLNSVFNRHGLKPSIVLENHDLNTLIALAEAGYGVAISPSTVSVERRPVVVMAIMEDGQPLGTSTGLVWQRGRRMPTHLQGFIDIASQHLRKHFPGMSLGLPKLPDFRSRKSLT